MEKEHTFSLRSGDYPRPRVAFPHRRVATRPRRAPRQGLLSPEDDSRHPHLRE
uniref:WD-40 repeat-containing protein MSI1-like n=1 Tax=Rhizophora mucronata TaxID=61149 RepID=A0A2P2MP70_RHIMU